MRGGMVTIGHKFEGGGDDRDDRDDRRSRSRRGGRRDDEASQFRQQKSAREAQQAQIDREHAAAFRNVGYIHSELGNLVANVDTIIAEATANAGSDAPNGGSFAFDLGVVLVGDGAIESLQNAREKKDPKAAPATPHELIGEAHEKYRAAEKAYNDNVAKKGLGEIGGRFARMQARGEAIKEMGKFDNLFPEVSGLHPAYAATKITEFSPAFGELQEALLRRGFRLEVKSDGPFVRLEARALSKYEAIYFEDLFDSIDQPQETGEARGEDEAVVMSRQELADEIAKATAAGIVEGRNARQAEIDAERPMRELAEKVADLERKLSAAEEHGKRDHAWMDKIIALRENGAGGKVELPPELLAIMAEIRDHMKAGHANGAPLNGSAE